MRKHSLHISRTLPNAQSATAEDRRAAVRVRRGGRYEVCPRQGRALRQVFEEVDVEEG